MFFGWIGGVADTSGNGDMQSRLEAFVAVERLKRVDVHSVNAFAALHNPLPRHESGRRSAGSTATVFGKMEKCRAAPSPCGMARTLGDPRSGADLLRELRVDFAQVAGCFHRRTLGSDAAHGCAGASHNNRGQLQFSG